MLSFLTKNTNTNMGLQNHRHIIGSITNGKSCFVWVLVFYHIDDVTFLLWRNSASEDDINFVSHVQEYPLSFVELLNDCNRRA